MPRPFRYGFSTKIEITGEAGTPLMPIALDALVLAGSHKVALLHQF